MPWWTPLHVLAKQRPRRIERLERLRPPLPLRPLEGERQPIHHALGGRREDDRVDRVVTVVVDPLAVHLLQRLDTPSLTQPRRQRTRPRDDAALAARLGARFSSA